MFDLHYASHVARLKFLQSFAAEISRPIQAHEEPLEYIPTQAVAEYLAGELKLDGIIYPSAQLGGMEDNDDVVEEDEEQDRFARKNIALFDAAGIVASRRRRSHVKGLIDLQREPTLDELWQLNLEDLSGPQEVLRKPSLRYIKESASIVEIKGINIDYFAVWQS